jgi:hypothetical protein
LKQQLSQPHEAERCEFCHKPTAQLVEITPHPIPDLATIMGIKIYHYRCSDSDCGKTFTRQKKS